MAKNFLLLLFLLFVVPATAHADKQAIAVDVVACVNTTNGYSKEIYDEPWELAQAILEIPFDYERFRLAPDYYLVGGRMLGSHGTWSAFLYLGLDGWMVFETRAEDDRLDMFGASFVPTVVVEAFEACGAKWGGHWTGDYPIIEAETEERPTSPLVFGPILDWDDLLPPKPTD